MLTKTRDKQRRVTLEDCQIGPRATMWPGSHLTCKIQTVKLAFIDPACPRSVWQEIGGWVVGSPKTSQQIKRGGGITVNL